MRSKPESSETTTPKQQAGAQRGRPPQFHLSALLWLMVAVSMPLAYLRVFDASYTTMCLQTVVAALFLGALVGVVARRVWDAVYWSVLGALSTFVCVVGYRFVHDSFPYGWALVGALAGALAGAMAPGKPMRSILAGAMAGLAVMGGLAALFVGRHTEAVFEVASATIVGALLAAVIEVIEWVERRNAVPRYITATCLLLAMIGGNIAARLILGDW